jgi:hypothetical protein
LEVVEGKNTRIPMYDVGEGKVLLATETDANAWFAVRPKKPIVELLKAA